VSKKPKLILAKLDDDGFHVDPKSECCGTGVVFLNPEVDIYTKIPHDHEKFAWTTTFHCAKCSTELDRGLVKAELAKHSEDDFPEWVLEYGLDKLLIAVKDSSAYSIDDFKKDADSSRLKTMFHVFMFDEDKDEPFLCWCDSLKAIITVREKGNYSIDGVLYDGTMYDVVLKTKITLTGGSRVMADVL
jgi:hypothetical protein